MQSAEIGTERDAKISGQTLVLNKRSEPQIFLK